MLFVSCLRILASSRIPRYDLGRRFPSFLRWVCHKELCQCLVVLEEENSRLKASTAGLHESVDKSAKVVVSLRWMLNGALDDFELLKGGNNSLLVERDSLRDQVTDLDSELVTAKVRVTENIPALEARVASAEAPAADEAVAGEKCLIDFKAELVRDLTDLCAMYEHNIRSIGGLCSLICEGDPSVADYVRWLGVEVDSLLVVFAGVNENFVSVTIGGTLVMA
jgi:hypothetical protein